MFRTRLTWRASCLAVAILALALGGLRWGRSGQDATATARVAMPDRVAPALPADAVGPSGKGGPLLDRRLRAAMQARPDASLPVVLLMRVPAVGPDVASVHGAGAAPEPTGDEEGVDPDELRAAEVEARSARALRRLRDLRRVFEATSDDLMADLEGAAEAGQAKAPRRLWLADAIALEASPALIETLLHRPEIRWIGLDPELELGPRPQPVAADGAITQTATSQEAAVAWNLRQIQADEVWSLLGVDGSGVTVGVVDTGVDFHHPLLQSRYRGFRAGSPPQHAGNWWCSRGEDALCGAGDTYPVDGYGHGTHVLGSILGQGGIGVAPGADWIAARACGSDNCRFSWIVDALQWMTELGARAPDVVNLSLGTDDHIERLLFEPVIGRMVDAGIVVVAATGNASSSNNLSNVRAPASFTSTIGVGAVRQSGEVWHLSTRGLSKWWETKPDLVAPGVQITSTLPGGGLGLDTGTSMAAPHVSGVAALLLSARPDLRPEEVKQILSRTATPYGASRPDPAAGWGLVNAYAAVSSVMDVGQLRGQVQRVGDTRPITWAQVTVADPLGDPIATVGVAEDDGSYKVDLPPGDYLIIANAFGYRTGSQRGVEIVSGQETRLDLQLEPDEPMGVFEGRISDADSRASLSARIDMDELPFLLRSDETTGFSQRLPAGEYRLRISKLGYRVITDSITVKAGETLHRDYALRSAPRILLVDGDAWNYSDGVDYYRASLDRLGYVYDQHAVLDEWAGPGQPGGPPSAERMAAYDLVIWASPVSSPNQTMGAWELLAYLESGGRLFLSGQDALCIDAGRDVAGEPCNQSSAPHPYLRDKLELRVLRDYADERGQVFGLPGGPLEGMTLTLNGPGSMNNQLRTDVVDVVSPLNARLVAAYPGGQGAGVLADTCLAHRALALGFGFEGIAGAEPRDRVMQGVIEALMAPPPATGLEVELDRSDLVRPAGATAEYSLTLLNTGSATAAYTVEVQDARWPTELWDAGFSQRVDGRLSLSSCRSQRLGVRVQVPAGAPHGSQDLARLRILSASGAQTLSLRTLAPAPVLVVDGDFARNSEETYLRALEAAGLRYDHWELGLLRIQPRLPPTSTLLQYPMLIWFTGENLLHPERNFGLDAQRLVASYLDAGGRLLLSSEDYLYHWGETPIAGQRRFHREYLGLDGYVDNGGAAHQGPLSGGAGSLLEDVEACRMAGRRSDADFSDRIATRNLPGARVALRSTYGQPVAAQNEIAGGWKTLFLAFDAGFLDQDCADAVIGRAVDWFSYLANSRLELVDQHGAIERRRTFASGQTLHLRLRLQHAGPREAGEADLRWTIPAGATVDPASLPAELRWEAGELRWQGALPAFGERVFQIALRLDDDLPEGAEMASEAHIYSDGVGITRHLRWWVNAPDVRRSSKSVPDAQRDLMLGDSTTFVVNVVNAGTRPLASWRVTDTLPAGLDLVEGSWLSEHGSVVRLAPNQLVWSGDGLPEDSATSLTYSARVATRAGGWLTNRAALSAEGGPPLWLSASVFARPQLLLPWLGWQQQRDP